MDVIKALSVNVELPIGNEKYHPRLKATFSHNMAGIIILLLIKLP